MDYSNLPTEQLLLEQAAIQSELARRIRGNGRNGFYFPQCCNRYPCERTACPLPQGERNE